ncbi:MAG: metallophosphoesterase [Oscillospiraceae bacterium]|nr:metallophosphoesterase [Oscillospiraceae bacterium]
MWRIAVITPIFAVFTVLYFYRFLRRACWEIGFNTNAKSVRVIMWAAAVGIAVLCCNLFKFYGVAILHLLVIAVVVDVFNIILKRVLGENFKHGYTAWKRLHALGVLPVFLTLCVLIGGYINLHNIQQTDYEVLTPKNIRTQGYRVALIADVHYGVSLDREGLEETVQRINAQNPDIAVLCGDISDNSTTAEQIEEVFEVFSGIKSKYGVFFVYGNHDRPYGMMKSGYDDNHLYDVLEKSGITVLCDDTYKIGNDFTIIGRQDRRYSDRNSLEQLFKDVDKNDFIMVLDHQPNQYAENAEAGTDLILSGHTHGGQLWPMQYVFELGKFNDAVYGHLIKDGMQAIVTSGLAGWEYPIKTASPAEYVIIDIKKDTK